MTMIKTIFYEEQNYTISLKERKFPYKEIVKKRVAWFIVPPSSAIPSGEPFRRSLSPQTTHLSPLTSLDQIVVDSFSTWPFCWPSLSSIDLMSTFLDSLMDTVLFVILILSCISVEPSGALKAEHKVSWIDLAISCERSVPLLKGLGIIGKSGLSTIQVL